MSQVTVEDILDAMDGAIKTIDGIISSLDDLENEIQTFDRQQTVIKTVVNAASVLGGVLTVGALFTGGSRYVAAGLAATAVAGNIAFDFRDRNETNECMEKIQPLVDKFVRDAENIQKLFERFKKEMKSTINDLMRRFKLDNNSAILLALGGGELSNNPREKFEIPDMATMGKIFGVTFSATKEGFSDVAGRMFGAGDAIVSITLVTEEVVNLIESLFETHITVSKIQEVRSKLSAEQSNVKKTYLGIKAI